MARPKKYNIDTKQLEQLASFGCTNKEMAAFFSCTENILSKSYSEFITKGRDKGKIRLRQMQWKAAEGGNVSMLIWLGKQVLAQTESPMLMEDELVEGFDIEII
tara:strand:+ start:1560 stop:1871 length:312 start_codon:yes stop_codon:yes gene_type:complete